EDFFWGRHVVDWWVIDVLGLGAVSQFMMLEPYRLITGSLFQPYRLESLVDLLSSWGDAPSCDVRALQAHLPTNGLGSASRGLVALQDLSYMSITWGG